MQRLNTLWQLVNVATTIKDLAQHKRTYQFVVNDPITFYLQTHEADVHLSRWEKRQVEMTVTLQASFGWRVATDQDEAGVYVAAKRRAVVGRVSGALFEIFVPYDTYIIVRLQNCNLKLNGIGGEFHFNPADERLLLSDGKE
ncbi:MAG: hypothetical protein CUN56_06435 [Phototrophicales bacterium]|nr:MAG: hypothetical protein CUN56_06435 [Phototrophicales bacterium]RMG75279.1 MAG: hypothetical protein D6711_06910 [Chloroflexota bacterium]